MMAYDFLAICLAQFGALWLRFDLRYSMIPKVYLANMYHMAPYMAVIVIVVLWRFRLYQSIWRFASFVELVRIIGAATVISLVRLALILCGVFGRMPVSYYIVGWGLSICLLTLVRFGYRAILLLRANSHKGTCVNVRAHWGQTLLG